MVFFKSRFEKLRNDSRRTGSGCCVGEDDAASAAILPQRQITGSLRGTMAAAGGIIVPYGRATAACCRIIGDVKRRKGRCGHTFVTFRVLLLWDCYES